MYISHSKKENLRDRRYVRYVGVYQSSPGYDSGNRVLFMNLFINLSLVTIALKHHIENAVKKVDISVKISDFFVRFRKFRGFRRFRGSAVRSSSE